MADDVQTVTPTEQEPVYSLTPPVSADVTPPETPATEVAPPVEAVAPQEAAPIATPTPVVAPVQAPATEPAPYEFKDLEDNADFKKLVQAFKTNTLSDYVKIATADYDKLDDRAVLRTKFDKDYAALSQQERDKLFEHELTTRYNLTGDEDGDQIGQLKLRNDAFMARQAMKDEQSNFKIPEYKAPETPQAQQSPEQQRAYEQQLQIINNHPELTQFETNRNLSLGAGEEMYKYEVPKELDVRAAAVDPVLFLSTFWKDSGTGTPQLDMNKWIRTMSYANDPAKYDAALIAHGKSLQAKADYNELNNPSGAKQTLAPDPKAEYVVKNTSASPYN